MTLGYDRTPTGLADSGGGGKKLSIVRKVIPDVYLAFRFETKLTILVAINGVALVKN